VAGFASAALAARMRARLDRSADLSIRIFAPGETGGEETAVSEPALADPRELAAHAFAGMCARETELELFEGEIGPEARAELALAHYVTAHDHVFEKRDDLWLELERLC